jgi:hypothetical protein
MLRLDCQYIRKNIANFNEPANDWKEVKCKKANKKGNQQHTENFNSKIIF